MLVVTAASGLLYPPDRADVRHSAAGVKEGLMTLERTRVEREERLNAGLLHSFGLPQYAGALRGEAAYTRTGRNGVTLVKTGELRVVLEVLRAGAELAEHRAPGPITVQVLEGEIRFHTGDDTFRVRQGE